MRNKILSIVLVSLLSGCGFLKTNDQPINLKPVYSDSVPIPKVDPTALKDIQWKIMNKTELENFLKTAPPDFVIYTLDETNSAVLIGNIQELNRYIKSQQEVINYLIGIINSRQTEQKKP